MPDSLQQLFHPLTWKWFSNKFAAPTEVQNQGWQKIRTGENVLIAAPTGMGKTLTSFLCLIDRLIVDQLEGTKREGCQVLYISPLKALGNDIQKNLMEPLQEIRELARSEGYGDVNINVAVRSGDTTANERRKMIAKPPQILITTPESFHILICAEKSREILSHVKTVILDEIHAVSGDKRGAHLSLCLERLDNLVHDKIQRIGLSATQKPIERMANVLVGERYRDNEELDCHIVDVGSHRQLDLSVKVVDKELAAIASHEYWKLVFEELIKHINQHKATIIFTNTRRMVERIAHQLSQDMGKEKVAAHHGSLSKEARLDAEQRLKSGEIPVIVASASLELGIDVGDVDLVIQIGSPRVIANLLQRVGRAGHRIGEIPKAYIYPLTLDELMQTSAAVRAVKQQKLDEIVFQKSPLDILAQIIVAECVNEEQYLDDLWNTVTKSFYFKTLKRKDFNEVIEMLSEGISTSLGRSSAYLHFDRVNGRLSPRRAARLSVITSGGTIPEQAEYDVVEEPDELFIGRINEDFAIESMAGSIFLLGNRSWRITRVEKNKVRVVDAQGAPPTIPFWLGEAPSRTFEMSQAVSEVRQYMGDHLPDKEKVCHWLMCECELDEVGANQLIRYVEENVNILGAVPTMDTIIAERFFDEGGGMQLILHTPFGGRINRAWGLAMRKRFCLNFDFELQCAATDDGLVFSLGEQHSFPLESVWHYLHPNSLIKDLTHAVLPHPLFLNRFRWNASRALAVLRFRGGKKVPIHIQRMISDDVLASIFPAHVGCQDNREGPIEPVDHPLVNETLKNCFYEAMDVPGLTDVLHKMSDGSIKTLSVDTKVPSPFSHEILNASPYAFLDDAPLEERRSRAVNLRRFNPDDDLANLDPELIDEVISDMAPDFRNADELHDQMLSMIVVDPKLVRDEHAHLNDLVMQNRISLCTWTGENGQKYEGYTSAERWVYAKHLFPDIELQNELPNVNLPKNDLANPERQDAINLMMKGWMEVLGPISERELVHRFGFSDSQVSISMAYLESMGLVIQGKFSGNDIQWGENQKQWCWRTILMRIHSRTIQRLRKQVEPVTQEDYMRFLLRWQHVHPSEKLKESRGLIEVLAQLQGMEFSLETWKDQVLKNRVNDFVWSDLENEFLNGRFIWCKVNEPVTPSEEKEKSKASRLNRNYSFAILRREDVDLVLDYKVEPEQMVDFLTGVEQEVYEFLLNKGASFFTDIVRGIRQLEASVEDAVKSLVAKGLISCDGLGGLKKIFSKPEQKHPRNRFRSKRIGIAIKETAGRWFLWEGNLAEQSEEEMLEFWVQQLLWRYGILIREVTVNEDLRYPWWKILSILRRMEARGEVRGGRFVKGIAGEQFASPEAVEALKVVRKSKDEEISILYCGDPLNLCGVLIPGPGIPKNSKHFLLLKGGQYWKSGVLGDLITELRNENASPDLIERILVLN